jgi:hypothetical protein
MLSPSPNFMRFMAKLCDDIQIPAQNQRVSEQASIPGEEIFPKRRLKENSRTTRP